MMEFLQTPAGIMTLVFGLAFALVGLVIGGSKLYRWLRVTRQGFPYEEELEEALLPYLYQSIMVAYKTSERLMDEVGVRLRGVDKAKIARMVYEHLPSDIRWRGYTLNWKVYVDKDTFSEYIENRFDELVDIWSKASRGLLDMIEPDEIVTTM
jgi:hypothetical protein